VTEPVLTSLEAQSHPACVIQSGGAFRKREEGVPAAGTRRKSVHRSMTGARVATSCAAHAILLACTVAIPAMAFTPGIVPASCIGGCKGGMPFAKPHTSQWPSMALAASAGGARGRISVLMAHGHSHSEGHSHDQGQSEDKFVAGGGGEGEAVSSSKGKKEKYVIVMDASAEEEQEEKEGHGHSHDGGHSRAEKEHTHSHDGVACTADHSHQEEIEASSKEGQHTHSHGGVECTADHSPKVEVSDILSLPPSLPLSLSFSPQCSLLSFCCGDPPSIPLAQRLQ
jgi:hypothetical protein